MNRQANLLAARIDAELKELVLITDRIKLAWEKAQTQNDDCYLDSVALNLHGFYSCLERILEKLASSIDGTVPSGANWHQELLEQMSLEVPNVRPAVISSELKELLEDYLGFRHVVRNVYTFHLKPEKLAPLVGNIGQTMDLVTIEMEAFSKFLAHTE